MSVSVRRLLTATCVLLALSVTLPARVRHIPGLLDVEWKQKGSQPVSLTIYDETISPEWPAVIEDAVTQWDISTAFQLAYVRGPGPNEYPPPVGTVRVIERVGPRDQGLIIPNAQGVVTWWTVELNPVSLITTPAGWTILQVMQREARHELGHVLTLDDHNVSFPGAPWGGGAEPGCTMANGYQVTQFDLGLICERYSCR